MIDTATRALLSLGCFIGVGAALMLPLTGAGTAERVVAMLALLLGVVAVAGSVLVRLLLARRAALPYETSDGASAARDAHLRHDDAAEPHHDDDVVTTKENR
ncbi:hypothetical protein [Brachybacterium sp. UMB0905]|uniref:hypothetical protein n=1 Tax=Brachybacterium sp. UMB0905 TaxID=2069310 RepID=UPI000C7F93A0|nr:hypothetical protein [Brachybacterium sp. UMB0905]PMC74585.1 hypothetical protein CJ197_12850 [Brachybacterium sp. UMB0905]